MNNVRNIQAIIKGDVNMVGYRHMVEGHALVRGLAGFVHNFTKDSVLLYVGGHKNAISDFFQDLKLDNAKPIEIETLEIKEDIKLPYPFGRVIGNEMREISERMDKGNMILDEMNVKLDKLDNLDTMNNSIISLGDKFDAMGNTLDTLPERIAEAMKR